MGPTLPYYSYSLVCFHAGAENSQQSSDVLQAPEQEQWKPLALMVAEFEASTPARFNHGPRAVQYVPPAQLDSNARVGVRHSPCINCHGRRLLCIPIEQCTAVVKVRCCNGPAFLTDTRCARCLVMADLEQGSLHRQAKNSGTSRLLLWQ